MDKAPPTPRTPGKASAERSGSASELSEQEDHRRDPTGSARRLPGETTTHVQHDMGDNTVVAFEMLIVKVPLLSLHGLQFKRIEGNTWQFKNLAGHILKELRL
ncbi:kinase associated domain 1-domain-containing protein [Microdochium trichocladiopsis]|uniref:non-specific serine/threonine protein kinase n=1 Tax=Microdochium trichocladiopsis TaxID=1682393 RepID=A0A9P9BI19_9PEZI|nr:kinase associated domain 1-domain-containing protein [Microdochium trichocladiopsis]KAH7009450.1 kinase associated domain 1-domain-containing protein [Microdochium trichocladiopsis]